MTLTELEKCDGEARANNRKAKLIFFYEWELVVKWKTKADDSIEGKITIPNLSEEHTDMKDVDLEVTLTSSSSSEAQKVKESLRKGIGAGNIRHQLQKYVDALRVEFSQGLILPRKEAADKGAAEKKKAAAAVKQTHKEGVATDALKKLSVAGGMQKVEKIKLEQRFKCTGQEIYNVLVQPELLRVFTAAPVNVDEIKAGVSFSLLNGNVECKMIELVPFTKIVQKWRLKTWPAEHFSSVEFTISQSSDDTLLSMIQSEVPAKEVENTKMGWQRYYFEAIKRTFGFGSGFF